MTTEDLKAYINARMKIGQLERSIRKLTTEIEEMEEKMPLVSDVVAHGRRGKKPIKTTVITGFPDADYQRRTTRLLSLRLELETMLGAVSGQKAEVETFVASIPSAEVTEIIELKYMGERELTWQEVADEMTRRKFGVYTRSSVRKIFRRYMDKQ